MTAVPSRGREGSAQRGKVPFRGTLKRTSPYGHSDVKVDPWLFSSRVTGNVVRRYRTPKGGAYQVGFKCCRHYADRGFSTPLHPTLWAIMTCSRVNFYIDQVSVLYMWVCPACITGERVERATVRAENI
jgi:hypothetical protein